MCESNQTTVNWAKNVNVLVQENNQFSCCHTISNVLDTSKESIGTASADSANSVESDHGCTMRIYFDNTGDNMMLTFYNATLTSQTPC